MCHLGRMFDAFLSLRGELRSAPCSTAPRQGSSGQGSGIIEIEKYRLEFRGRYSCLRTPLHLTVLYQKLEAMKRLLSPDSSQVQR